MFVATAFAAVVGLIVSTAPAALAATVPGAPTGVVATAGNAQATVTWVAPTSNGGSAITGYTVTSSPGGLTSTTTGALTATVSGLTNGTAYTFTVKAKNAIGMGSASSPSAAVTPATVPGAPTGVTAAPGNAQATVTWVAPASNGGSAITGYTVTSSPGGKTATTAGALTAIVTGLTNGTAYTFTVKATNAKGTGAASSASSAVTPAAPPGAPTSVAATAGNAQATVTWVAPSSNGGSAITGYTVTSSPGGKTATTTGALTATVTGLTNGTSYTFTVTAKNAVSTGAASGASAAVTPTGPPSAPTSVTAAAGNAQATVTWVAPSSNGGSAITGYTVTSSPGAKTATTTGALTATVTGLTNGTAYTFTVTATNAKGTSPASAASAAVTPAAPTVPGAPTGATATAGNAQATVTWIAPASNGGSAITGYTVTSSPGAKTATTTGALTATVTGLTNGTAYTFTVKATNAVGTGAASSPSAAVTPAATVPGAPTAVTATAGNAQATVSWLAPSSNGGSAITGYTVTSSPGGFTATTTGALTATVTGLTNGTVYTFAVTAKNTKGTGAASGPSPAVTPTGPPGYPTNIVATPAAGGQMTVTWTAPTNNGGSPITSYTALSSDNTTINVGPGTTSATFNVYNMLSYSFTVFASNASGDGGFGAWTPNTAPLLGSQSAVDNTTLSFTTATIAKVGSSTSWPFTVEAGAQLGDAFVGGQMYGGDSSGDIVSFNPVQLTSNVLTPRSAFDEFCDPSTALLLDTFTSDQQYLYFRTHCGNNSGSGAIMRALISTGAISQVLAPSYPTGPMTVGPNGVLYYTEFGYPNQWNIYDIGGSYMSVNLYNYPGCGPAYYDGSDQGEMVADSQYLWILQTSTLGTELCRVSLADGSVTAVNTSGGAGNNGADGGGPLYGTLVSAGQYLYGYSLTALGGWHFAYNIVRYNKSTGVATPVLSNIPALPQMFSDGTNLWIGDRNYNSGMYKIGGLNGPVNPSENRNGSNSSEPTARCSCGDPVDPMTGALTESATDVSVAGRGVGLTWARAYDSQASASPSRVGAGWIDSYNMSIIVDPQAGTAPLSTSPAVDVVQENGSRVEFARNPDGSYTPASRVLARLTQNANGTWTFVREARTTFAFDPSGRLTAESALTGEGVTLSYAGNGTLSTVTDSSGRTLTVAYGTNGLVSSVTDPAGRITSYGYDTAGHLTTVTDPASDITHYGYDGNGRLSTLTTPAGGVTSTSYDTNGWVSSQTDPRAKTSTYAYSSESTPGFLTTTMTDPLGLQTSMQFQSGDMTVMITGYGSTTPATTTFVYDTVTNELSETINPDGAVTSATFNAAGDKTSATDADGNTTRWTYDSLGDLTSTTDPLGATQTRTYDAYGDLTGTSMMNGSTLVATTLTHGNSSHPADVTSSTDAGGFVTTMTYDSYGDVATVTDPTGDKTSFTYDADGWLLTRVAPDGNVTGGNPAAYTTTYGHDGAGRITSAIDPLSHAVTTVYDGDGNALSVTDAGGHVTRHTYDLQDHLASTTAPDGTVTNDGYDDNGRLTTVDDNHGHVTTTTHDPQGNALTVTDPAGAVTTRTYSPAGLLLTAVAPNGGTTTYAYDHAGQLLAVTDPDGGIMTHVYDADGRLTSVTDPDTHTTSYAYDALGNQTTTTRADSTTVTNSYNARSELVSYTDGAGKITSYAYDNDGRQISVTDPDLRTTRYGYDASSHQTTTTDATGRVTTTSYDAAGETTGVSYSDGVTAAKSYTYNADGSRATMTDATGNTTYAYDAAGRPSGVTDGSAATVGYTYDTLGRVATISYPDGRQVTHGYDTDNRLTSVTDSASQTTLFGYDGDGNVVTTTHPDGTVDTAAVDLADRQTAITMTTGAGGTTLASFGYTYTLGGLQATLSDSLTGTTSGSDTYSTLNQVTASATAPGTYGYDNAGNLTSLANGSQLGYDPAGQLTTMTPTAGPVTMFTFDGVGNRAAATVGSATTTYGYNQAAELTSSNAANGNVTYTYNADGLRTSTTTSTASQHFVWDDTTASPPLLLSDATNDYIYGPNNTVVEQVSITSGSRQYLHPDAIGSTRLITDSTGTVVGSTSYEAYGNVAAHTGTASTPFGYTGQYTDPTGLIYLRARMYDPATAQFLTVDPMVGDTKTPYAYVDGNPLNATDPSGLCGIFGSGPCPGANALYDVLTHGPGKAVAGVAVNIGRGATGGLTDKIDNAISSGASCTVAQNTTVQNIAFAASMLDGEGEVAAVEDGLTLYRYGTRTEQDAARLSTEAQKAAETPGFPYGLSTSRRLSSSVADSGEYGSATVAQLKAVGLGVVKTGGKYHYTVTFPETLDEPWAEAFRNVFYGKLP